MVPNPVENFRRNAYHQPSLSLQMDISDASYLPIKHCLCLLVGIHLLSHKG